MKTAIEFENKRTEIWSTKETLREQEHNYSRTLRQSFREEANKLFHDHAVLENFSWTQGSDEECDFEFFVDKHEFSINGIEDPYSINELSAAAKDVAEFLELFDDEDLKSLFGDAVEIKTTRSTTEVSYFDTRTITAQR